MMAAYNALSAYGVSTNATATYSMLLSKLGLMRQKFC